jgi:hypothetical protein
LEPSLLLGTVVLREQADQEADRRHEAHDGHDDPDPDIISIVIPTIPPGRLAEARRVIARETPAALGRRRKINGVDAWRWSRSG